MQSLGCSYLHNRFVSRQYPALKYLQVTLGVKSRASPFAGLSGISGVLSSISTWGVAGGRLSSLSRWACSFVNLFNSESSFPGNNVTS